MNRSASPTDPPQAHGADDQPAALRLASWNCRYHAAGQDQARRMGRIIRTLDSIAADVCCLQEVGPDLLRALRSDLPPGDLHVARRHPHRPLSEALTIWCRRGLARERRFWHCWLGPEPSRPTPAWDALVPRVFLCLRLADPNWSRPLAIGNCHFDHLGRRSRRESATLLGHLLIDPLALPVLAGDFNGGPGSPAVAILRASPLALVDARRSSEEPARGPQATWFGPWPLRRRLDLILHDPDLRILRHQTHLSPSAWRPPSDHRPVSADLCLPGQG